MADGTGIDIDKQHSPEGACEQLLRQCRAAKLCRMCGKLTVVITLRDGYPVSVESGVNLTGKPT